MLIALLVACIGLFAVSYSARSTHFAERYDGLIHALALGSVIKFVAFLLVGVSTITLLFGYPTDILNRVVMQQAEIPALQRSISVGNLCGLILIGASSVLLLPSQFYVTVVENKSDRELRMAQWFIPVSLLIAGLFVLPLAMVGPIVLADHSSADFYFLSLPLHAGQYWLGIIALPADCRRLPQWWFFRPSCCRS
ncbi:hypothetical protein [Phyllobacterium zundukense]|uniref:hypothetical protein n=1 Tax=Phyllobacterium zundukense TaxID=1867719 RepID=UPI000C1C2431|nr:hypothetical protein [Phyllobacterium zundukense]